MENEHKIYQSYYLIITAIVFSVILFSGFFQIQKVIAEPVLIDFYKFMDKGKTLYESHNYTGASIYFEKALNIDPMDVDALMYMGYSLGNSGRPELAIEYYDKVLSIDPDHHIRLSKEKDQSTLIFHEERLELYDQRLAMNPTDKEAILDKGSQFKEIGKYTEAIKYVDEALTVDPTDPMILNERGDISFRLGNHSEAIKYYDKILTVYPNEPRALASIGDVLYNMGNYSGAIEYYNRVLSLDPEYDYVVTHTVNTLVSDILKTIDNDTAALHQLDKRLIFYPNSTDTLREKAFIYLNQGNYSEALKIYDKILAIDPGFRSLSGDPMDLSTLEIKGYILSTMGNDTDAIKSFDQVLDINPSDVLTLTLKGNALFNLGVYDGATAYYDNAQENNSSSTSDEIQGLVSNLTTSIVPGAKAIGDDDAIINIVEFGDYQDPLSARFNQETKDAIVSKYIDTGLVRFGFKDLIINDLPNDKMSTLAAEASYCAADQDKYWEYHDELYNNSRGENTGWITQDSLVDFASNVNMTNIPEFTDCLESHKYNSIVVENDIFAKNLGLISTPTFLILKQNSTKMAAVEGAQPLEVFDDVIAQFLTNTL